MAKFAAFHDARNLFISHTGYKEPLSYEDWKAKPDKQKAALLFVQFYNQITLAWEKADTLDFGDDAEGVTTVLQYLDKQVKQIIYFRKDDPNKKATKEFVRNHPDQCIEVERRIIEENPKKFSENYIYRVAYNCLYCITGHDRKSDKDRMSNETSSIVTYDGKELDLFDTIQDFTTSAENQYSANSLEQEFWSVIEDTGVNAEKVMRYLLTNDASVLKKLNKKNKYYGCDPLGDVEVSIDAVDNILATLREKFLSMPANSHCGELISTFQCAF